jgi:hypothetical protein
VWLASWDKIGLGKSLGDDQFPDAASFVGEIEADALIDEFVAKLTNYSH